MHHCPKGLAIIAEKKLKKMNEKKKKLLEKDYQLTLLPQSKQTPVLNTEWKDEQKPTSATGFRGVTRAGIKGINYNSYAKLHAGTGPVTNVGIYRTAMEAAIVSVLFIAGGGTRRFFVCGVGVRALLCILGCVLVR